MSEGIHTSNQIKVFILYLLMKTGYPLRFSDIASIVIRDGFVDYFEFVSNFHELCENGHIAKVNAPEDTGSDEREMYQISDTGRKIAEELSDNMLNSEAREKAYISALRYLSFEKRGTKVSHEIETAGDGSYIFKCSMTDCDGKVFSMELKADSYYQIEKMRKNFEDRPDIIYRGILSLLSGGAEYLGF